MMCGGLLIIYFICGIRQYVRMEIMQEDSNNKSIKELENQTEYNQQKTLRIIRKQNEIPGESRTKNLWTSHPIAGEIYRIQSLEIPRITIFLNKCWYTTVLSRQFDNLDRTSTSLTALTYGAAIGAQLPEFISLTSTSFQASNQDRS